MSYFDASREALPAPTLPNGTLAADTADIVTFTVGPWPGFDEGDTVQILSGFDSQVLGSVVITARKSFLGDSTKVNSVNVPVRAAALRALGTGLRYVKARWVQNGGGFGNRLSAESTVQIEG